VKLPRDEALPPEIAACLIREAGAGTRPTGTAAPSRRGGRAGKKAAASRALFVLGPLPLSWLRRVQQCGQGAWPVVFEWLSWDARQRHGRRSAPPSLVRLAETWHVSRWTLRRAVGQLEAAGLLVTQRDGRGRAHILVRQPLGDKAD
jgi:hypothetical protein